MARLKPVPDTPATPEPNVIIGNNPDTIIRDEAGGPYAPHTELYFDEPDELPPKAFGKCAQGGFAPNMSPMALNYVSTPEDGERRRVPGELGPVPQTLEDVLKRVEALEQKSADYERTIDGMSRVLAANGPELDALQAWAGRVNERAHNMGVSFGPVHPNAVGVAPPKRIDDLPTIDDLPKL